ncbi:hypothetical protein OC835_004357 [Tilletia horrida]|nr:hypothetical protein OC835_004357 [Tilletia horrida]KAK0565856.1 hypothetical protein OC844_001032 [Tilletia horrida]
MADKDNANPIIHAPGAVTRARAGEGISGKNAQWWRDPAAAELNAGASGSGNLGIGSNGSASATGVGASGNSVGSGSLWLSHACDDDLDGEDDDEDELAALAGENCTNGSAVHAAKGSRDEIDPQEIFDLVRSISDPEHPLTLEQLAVVNAAHVSVDEGDADAGRQPSVKLEFTPTIPHCSMATLIGLSLRVRLLRALPPRYKVDISIRKGTHQSETQVNKQLNDKERVAAAMENNHLLTVVQQCLSTAHRRGMTEAQALEQADRMATELGLVT